MASEAVKKILEAEAAADKRSAEAGVRAEEIVSSAKSKASIAVQKRLTDAKTELGKLKDKNKKKLDEYTAAAEEKCSSQLGKLADTASANSDKAVEAVIKAYFS